MRRRCSRRCRASRCPIHLAAAGDGRRLRALHQLGDPAAAGRPVCLLRGRAARVGHGDRDLPGALARAGVRDRRVGLRAGVGVLGHGDVHRRRETDCRLRVHRARRAPAGSPLGDANGRGNGALRKLGAVQEGVLRRSFVRNGESSTRRSGPSCQRNGSRPRPSGARPSGARSSSTEHFTDS